MFQNKAVLHVQVSDTERNGRWQVCKLSQLQKHSFSIGLRGRIGLTLPPIIANRVQVLCSIANRFCYLLGFLYRFSYKNFFCSPAHFIIRILISQSSEDQPRGDTEMEHGCTCRFQIRTRQVCHL